MPDTKITFNWLNLSPEIADFAEQVRPVLEETRTVLTDPNAPLKVVVRLCRTWHDLEEGFNEDTANGLPDGAYEGVRDACGLVELEELMQVVGMPPPEGDRPTGEYLTKLREKYTGTVAAELLMPEGDS